MIGPPHPISNLRPVIRHKPQNETKLQERLRKLQIDTQLWNQQFWENHNLKFTKVIFFIYTMNMRYIINSYILRNVIRTSRNIRRVIKSWMRTKWVTFTRSFWTKTGERTSTTIWNGIWKISGFCSCRFASTSRDSSARTSEFLFNVTFDIYDDICVRLGFDDEWFMRVCLA